MVPRLCLGGATRYARPWRPVKPLDIMDVVGHKWVRQFLQRRRDREPDKYDGDVGEEAAVSCDVESVASVEVLDRLRKGILGMR
jgi:hypothetical protein